MRVIGYEGVDCILNKSSISKIVQVMTELDIKVRKVSQHPSDHFHCYRRVSPVSHLVLDRNHLDDPYPHHEILEDSLLDLSLVVLLTLVHEGPHVSSRQSAVFYH